MTISEQLREAALYAYDPEKQLKWQAFANACKFDGTKLYFSWRDVRGRTFLLLVAEALE